jgi:hypothetical protein
MVGLFLAHFGMRTQFDYQLLVDFYEIVVASHELYFLIQQRSILRF